MIIPPLSCASRSHAARLIRRIPTGLPKASAPAAAASASASPGGTTLGSSATMSQENVLCLSAVSVTATHCERAPNADAELSGTCRRPYMNVADTSPYSGCAARCSAATASRSAFAPPGSARAATDAGTATTRLVPSVEVTSNTSGASDATSPARSVAYARSVRRWIDWRDSEKKAPFSKEAGRDGSARGDDDVLGLGASSAESRRARERRGCRRSGVRVRVGLVQQPRRASAPPTFSRRRRRPARAKAHDAVGGWSRAVGFPSRAASIGKCARTHRVRRAIPASVLPSPVVGHHRASTGAAHSQPPRREK